MKKDLPVYDIFINEEDLSQGVARISLVDEPAIGVDWIKLRAQDIIELDFSVTLTDNGLCFGCPPNGDGMTVKGEPDKRCKGDSKAGGSKGGGKNGANKTLIPKEGELYDKSKYNNGEKAPNGTDMYDINGPEWKNPELRQANVDAGLEPLATKDGWINVKSSDPRANNGLGNKKIEGSPFYESDAGRMANLFQNSRTLEEDRKISHPLSPEKESYIDKSVSGVLAFNERRGFGYTSTKNPDGSKTISFINRWYKRDSSGKQYTENVKSDIFKIKNGRLTPLFSDPNINNRGHLDTIFGKRRKIY